MTDQQLIYLSIFIPILAMVSIPLFPRQLRASANFIWVLLLAVITSIPAFKAITGTPVLLELNNNLVFGDLSIHIDSLSAWFVLIINLTCINGAFFGIGYMKQYQQQTNSLSMHWIMFVLFHASMIWVCMVQNGLAFLIVWELMSISSFMLVIFNHMNKTTLKAGINYLVQMYIGVLFLSAAFIWVYFTEGSFAFSAIEKFFSTNVNLWLFLLFFLGFGIKAGFVPLHSWLPQAHPAAPSHISGVMSGVIVKLGIYGIFRIAFLLKQDYNLIGEIIIILSVLTGCYGILNAAVHRDFKKMLAYCSIENIGIIGIGIGLGLIGIGNGNMMMTILGFSGALLHTLNHSLFKSLLFFSAGSVYQQTHTRDMEKLGGLVHSMPHTALLFLAGAMAIGGLPPFNGFVSEFLLYSGLLLGIKSISLMYITLMIFSVVALAFIGGISMLTFTKAFGTIFLGNPRAQLVHQPHEVSFAMRLPQYFILGIMLSVGLFPQFYFSCVNAVIYDFFPATSKVLIPAALTQSMANIGLFAGVFIVMLILIYGIRRYFTVKHSLKTGPIWACGYNVTTARMQYSSKSYSKALGKLLNFILPEKKKYREILPSEIFPKERKYTSHYNDFFVSKIFNRIIDRLLFSLNYFQFIQNGNIQRYILYGIFFIVLIFLGTIFKFI